mmetsp:Transcript_4907/g.8971  ORF Transcript_4907/g.8971 Transcript_4907/m.8971 type:complete len:448 (+) Transcript_4907:99-1442(+)
MLRVTNWRLGVAVATYFTLIARVRGVFRSGGGDYDYGYGGALEREDHARTAVCLFGRTDALEWSFGSIRENIISALDADTFYSLSSSKGFDMGQILGSLSEGKRLFKGKIFGDEFHLKDWFSSFAGEKGRNALDRLNGNLCGGLDAKCPGGVGYMLHHLEVCLQEIEEAERNLRGGQGYDFVRIVRAESFVRAKDVPTSLLDGSTCYIPCPQEDNGGYCDQGGAACSREAASAYLGGLRILGDDTDTTNLLEALGKVVRNAPTETSEMLAFSVVEGEDGSIHSVSANAEVFLRARLEMRGVQIERIPDTSFRLCRCDKKKSSSLDHETVINCHNPSFYKHPCVWDEELGVGYTSQMESEHGYSRIVGRYVEACGWSRPMLFASTQQLSRINDIERMLENEECFVQAISYVYILKCTHMYIMRNNLTCSRYVIIESWVCNTAMYAVYI